MTDQEALHEVEDAARSLILSELLGESDNDRIFENVRYDPAKDPLVDDLVSVADRLDGIASLFWSQTDTEDLVDGELLLRLFEHEGI